MDDEGDRLALAELERDAPDRLDLAEALGGLADVDGARHWRLPSLEKLFNPRSVALVGASPREGSLGLAVLENLRQAGFPGPIRLVNPKYRDIHGGRRFARIATWQRCRTSSWWQPHRRRSLIV